MQNFFLELTLLCSDASIKKSFICFLNTRGQRLIGCPKLCPAYRWQIMSDLKLSMKWTCTWQINVIRKAVLLCVAIALFPSSLSSETSLYFIQIWFFIWHFWCFIKICILWNCNYKTCSFDLISLNIWRLCVKEFKMFSFIVCYLIAWKVCKTMISDSAYSQWYHSGRSYWAAGL